MSVRLLSYAAESLYPHADWSVMPTVSMARASRRCGLDAGLTSRGIRLIYQTNVRSLTKVGDDIQVDFSDGVTAPFGAVLFATGRSPNVEGLGLQDAGVRLIGLGRHRRRRL